jgi:hypothetical protein
MTPAHAMHADREQWCSATGCPVQELVHPRGPRALRSQSHLRVCDVSLQLLHRHRGLLGVFLGFLLKLGNSGAVGHCRRLRLLLCLRGLLFLLGQLADQACILSFHAGQLAAQGCGAHRIVTV